MMKRVYRDILTRFEEESAASLIENSVQGRIARA